MKRAPLLLALMILLSQCADKKTDQTIAATSAKEPAESNYPDLFIKTMTTIGDISKDSVSVVSGDYFEISTASVTKDGTKTYITTKVLQSSGVGEPYKYIAIAISDKNGEIIRFNSSTDFLNFMSERGYEMVTQSEKRFGADYTFKKK